jgi:hypothetical protein
MRPDQSLQHRLSRLREIWHQYIESKRQLMIVTERCCLRGWPDRSRELRQAFRLQELFCDREKLQLAYLIEARRLDESTNWNSLSSLSAISKLIGALWTSAEEAALAHVNAEYLEISQEINKCRAAVGQTPNDGPYRDAQRDPEYVRARQAAAEAIIACDKQLALDLPTS